MPSKFYSFFLYFKKLLGVGEIIDAIDVDTQKESHLSRKNMKPFAVEII